MSPEPVTSPTRKVTGEAVATLTLVNVVDNDSTGSTDVPADWTLTATGGGTPATTITGPGNSPAVTSQTVDVGDYTLSETGPDGYDSDGYVCTGNPRPVDTVTIDVGDNMTCTITHTARNATLSLVKTVTNDSGGTAVPTDWTLTAIGPLLITGPSGASEVTDRIVPIGNYVLSESDGPSQYTPSDWTCQGGRLSGTTVTVNVGDRVTCTINNDDIGTSWSIIKVSDPESGASVQPGEKITYLVGLVKNSGSNPANVVVNDDLSRVLDHATLVAGPVASAGTATLSGATLTWTVPTFSDTEVVQYTVRVNSDAFGVTLDNRASSPGSSPCAPDAATRLAADAGMGRILARRVSPFALPAVNNDLCPTETRHMTPQRAAPPTRPGRPHQPLPPTGGPGLGAMTLGLGLLSAGGLLLRRSRSH